MATNTQVIDQALGAIGVVTAGGTATTADAATGLIDLNNMMTQWEYSDKNFNWFVQDTAGDVAPIPDWALEGVIANLAVKMAATFLVPISGELALKASEGANMITRTLMNLNLEPSDMSHMPSGRDSGRNILTDS